MRYVTSVSAKALLYWKVFVLDQSFLHLLLKYPCLKLDHLSRIESFSHNYPSNHLEEFFASIQKVLCFCVRGWNMSFMLSLPSFFCLFIRRIRNVDRRDNRNPICFPFATVLANKAWRRAYIKASLKQLFGTELLEPSLPLQMFPELIMSIWYLCYCFYCRFSFLFFRLSHLFLSLQMELDHGSRVHSAATLSTRTPSPEHYVTIQKTLSSHNPYLEIIVMLKMCTFAIIRPLPQKTPDATSCCDVMSKAESFSITKWDNTYDSAVSCRNEASIINDECALLSRF